MWELRVWVTELLRSSRRLSDFYFAMSRERPSLHRRVRSTHNVKPIQQRNGSVSSLLMKRFSPYQNVCRACFSSFSPRRSPTIHQKIHTSNGIPRRRQCDCAAPQSRRSCSCPFLLRPFCIHSAASSSTRKQVNGVSLGAFAPSFTRASFLKVCACLDASI